MARRVGRFTKQETAELIRMFGEGNSVYKICRNLNRSQKSIRNNLIRLKFIEGEITPIHHLQKRIDEVVNISLSNSVLNYAWNLFTLSFLTIFFVVKPHFNILEIFLSGVFVIIYNF